MTGSRIIGNTFRPFALSHFKIEAHHNVLIIRAFTKESPQNYVVFGWILN